MYHFFMYNTVNNCILWHNSFLYIGFWTARPDIKNCCELVDTFTLTPVKLVKLFQLSLMFSTCFQTGEAPGGIRVTLATVYCSHLHLQSLHQVDKKGLQWVNPNHAPCALVLTNAALPFKY